jgi:hypothetical protein
LGVLTWVGSPIEPKGICDISSNQGLFTN